MHNIKTNRLIFRSGVLKNTFSFIAFLFNVHVTKIKQNKNEQILKLKILWIINNTSDEVFDYVNKVLQ